MIGDAICRCRVCLLVRLIGAAVRGGKQPSSGYLRAYATGDARLLWEVDTARDYPTVNGVSARGGAMDGPGPTIVDGMLYVNSGYAQWGGLPGNVRSQESLNGR